MRVNNLANNRKTAAAAIYGGLFLLMLLCNWMSPYAADDYRYMFSFYDNQRIGSLYDIFMSMWAHRYHMNGRLVVHALVQLFSMAPAWVFDVVNGLMYVLQIALLHKFSQGEENRSNSVLLALICGAWIFCPAFGQVNLWQDGSCNYLWSCVFALLYLRPMWEDCLRGKPLGSTVQKIFYLGLSFTMGACSENVSAAAIFMAMLLLLLMKLLDKRNPRPIWCGGLALAILGYLSIYTAPAQLREKGAEMKISVLVQNFLSVAARYWGMLRFLLVLFVVLLVINWVCRTSRRRILLALVFLAGSLAANFIMMFAQYYTDRSAIGAFVFLLGANAILLYPLAGKIPGKIRILCLCLILLVTAVPVYTGVQDIVVTGQKIRANEDHIIQCRDAGILDVQIPMIVPATKYSQLHGLKYIDTEVADIWPNYSMADYYGIDTLLGIPAP